MDDTNSDSRSIEPDAVLIDRVCLGQTSAFDELVRRYQSALARVARSRLGRADWADDVVQETFLAAFKSCASYDPRYSFRTWLWTILLNQCHAHYQRRTRGAPIEQSSTESNGARRHESDGARRHESDGARRHGQSIGRNGAGAARKRAGDVQSDSPLEALLAKERSEQLELLLGELTAVQADALRLRFFGGLKFHEIAEAMGCSLNAAKSRVRTGLVRMGELLGAAGAHQSAAEDWEVE